MPLGRIELDQVHVELNSEPMMSQFSQTDILANTWSGQTYASGTRGVMQMYIPSSKRQESSSTYWECSCQLYILCTSTLIGASPS